MSQATQPTTEAVYEALDTVEDPCMGAAGMSLSVLDLGLVNDVKIDGGSVEVEITFTEVACMFTHTIAIDIYEALAEVPGVEESQVTPVWSPAWSESRMNRRAREAFDNDAIFKVTKERATGRSGQ